MREIKFRAWHKEKKILREVLEISFSGGYVILAGFGSFGEIEAPIRDVELMQYTGLKDQNNAEIYESDIVKYKTTSRTLPYNTAPVVFFEGAFRLSESKTFFILRDYLSADLEVVGNIYENPEILKDK